MSKDDIRERDRIRKQRQRDREKCPTESGTKCDSPEISAESNKSRRQKARRQKAGKTSAHSVNEREGVDSVDVSAGDATKSQKGAKRALLVADLYNRYPRKVAKAEAFRAIEKAIVTVAKRAASGAQGDEDAAAQWARKPR